MIDDIDVEADLSSARNALALDRWPNLVTDLNAALAQTFSDVSSDDGYDLRVTVVSISLDGAVAMGDDEMFNTLKGKIGIYDDTRIVATVPLRVVATVDEDVAAEPGTILVGPSTDDVYTAMIAAFATATEDRVNGAELREIPETQDDGA